MDFVAFRARARLPLHPLAASPLFCHKHFFIHDIMHLMDCNGCAGLVYGGILLSLLYDNRVGANRAARLQEIDASRLAHYAARPGANRLPKIFWKNVLIDGWANLHGQVFKAAIMRSAAPFFYLVHTYCTSGSVEDLCLRGVIIAFVWIYDLLWTGPRFLLPPAMMQLREHCSAFGVHYCRLRALARRFHKLAWPVRPKVHKVMHIPEIAACINPRHAQCYGEESAVGSVTLTWKKSISGRYAKTVQKTVLAKRLTAMLLRLELGAEY